MTRRQEEKTGKTPRRKSNRNKRIPEKFSPSGNDNYNDSDVTIIGKRKVTEPRVIVGVGYRSHFLGNVLRLSTFIFFSFTIDILITNPKFFLNISI